MKTIPSFFEVYDSCGSAERQDLADIGGAISVLADTKTGSARTIASIEKRLIPALRHRKVKLLYDEEGAPAAYVIWASVSSAVERRFIHTKETRLHFTEWNEGDSIWIIDIAAKPGRLPFVLRYLRDDLFRDNTRVRYLTEQRKTVRVIEIDRSLLRGRLRSMPERVLICRCLNPSCEYFKHPSGTSEIAE